MLKIFGNYLLSTSNRTKHILMLVLIFIPAFFISSFDLKNDTCWIINTGKYIIHNGFPVKEPFTFHEGLNFSIQQWLTTVIFYLFYASFGSKFLGILIMVLFVIIVVTMYYSCMNLNGNRIMCTLMTFISVPYIGLFILGRPQIFSILIFQIEIILLELYVKNKNKSLLICVPILSVLLINMHAAMWLVFFILLIPYIIDGMEYSFFGILKTEKYGAKPLVGTFIASFLCGLLNPYGITNMIYSVGAYANNPLKSYVDEMASPDFKTRQGVAIFILMMTFGLIYILYRAGKSTLRHGLVTVGTLYMALSSLRSLGIFVVCSIPFVAYYLKDAKMPKFSEAYEKTLQIVCIFMINILIIFSYLTTPGMFFGSPKGDDEVLKGSTQYLIKNSDLPNARIYNEYETGGYLELNGLKPFIDSRGEIFIKVMNKKEDILKDYIDANTGKIYYKDFVKKYSFTDFLITKGKLMDIYLSKDSDYKAVYEDDAFIIYTVCKTANVKS